MCEKMLWPSSLWCRDSNPQPLEHKSPPITTRPGLMHFRINLYFEDRLMNKKYTTPLPYWWDVAHIIWGSRKTSWDGSANKKKDRLGNIQIFNPILISEWVAGWLTGFSLGYEHWCLWSHCWLQCFRYSIKMRGFVPEQNIYTLLFH